MGNFVLNQTAFSKCAPNISTNIRQCGTVTQCNARAVTQDELQTLFMVSGDFRVMDALFKHDMEIKMCEAVQNGLYDFFMANKIVVNKNIQTRRLSAGVLEIAPFILARQFSPINNQYWKFTGGTTAGTAYDYKIIVSSVTNIPIDLNSFADRVTQGIGIRVLLHGKSAGGSTIEKMYEVATATDNLNGSATLELIDKNAGSYLDADKVSAFSGGVGILRRGTPNVNSYEKWCAEAPSYLNWKNVPFWVEETRSSMCWSDLYQKWKKLVLEGNMLYEEFFNLDEVQKNKQLGKDWQDRITYQIFWGKGFQFQTADAYDQLDNINTFDGSPFGLGVDGGRCVGKRASIVGIYEQMAQCQRIQDCQGAQLNLPALFQEFYNMMRVRKGAGRQNAMQMDCFTDSATAERINTAMIQYYTNKSNNTLRMTYPVESFSVTKKAEFGFYFRSYPLFFPQGVTFNVIWHEFFDDYISAGTVALGASDNTTRVLWVLDSAGIYPGIVASDRKVLDTGKLRELAEINSSFGCVMKVPTRQQTLLSTTLTVIVECPKGNMIVENFSNQVPEPAVLQGVYPTPLGTSTTTTTNTPLGDVF